MTQVKIIRRCRACQSENIYALERTAANVVTFRCRDCGEIWNERVFPVGLPADPLESRLLKWRSRR